jgi:hypothetical protein
MRNGLSRLRRAVELARHRRFLPPAGLRVTLTRDRSRVTPMKTTIARAAAVAALLCAVPAAAQAPAFVPVQGVLRDSVGGTVDGVIPVSVRLYRNATGGAPFYVESSDVTFDDGAFVVYLGTTEPLDLEVFSGGGDVYLGVSLAGAPELTPRIALGTTTFAAFAEFAGAVEWGDVRGVPASLLDGDADTTYAVTPPLALSGTTLRLDSAGCDAGEGLQWNGAAWVCAITDTSGLQARVSGACAPGEAIRAIAADGSVVCDIAGDGGIVEVVAGNGLTGGGTSSTVALGVDLDEVQARVAAPCGAGTFVRSIARDGTPECVAAPAPVAGAGIVIDPGNVIRVDTAAVQARVAGPACTYGIASIAADGSVTCAANNDTNTTYSQGTGITISGTTISVDTTQIQRRLAASSCPYGIASVDVNGAITCAANNDTNTWPPGYNADCPDNNHFVYGFDDNGYPLCRSIADAARSYINSNCRMYIGWADSGRGCCDGLVYGTTTGALQGSFANSGSAVRRHVWDSSVNFQGLNLGGDVGDDDTLWVGFHCF